jgi:hypothetical protein
MMRLGRRVTLLATLYLLVRGAGMGRLPARQAGLCDVGR